MLLVTQLRIYNGHQLIGYLVKNTKSQSLMMIFILDWVQTILPGFTLIGTRCLKTILYTNGNYKDHQKQRNLEKISFYEKST